MQYQIKTGAPEKQRTACVIAGVFERRKLSDAAKALDKASGGALQAAMRRGDMDGAAGTTLLLHGLKGVASERVLLIGLGKTRTSMNVPGSRR